MRPLPCIPLLALTCAMSLAGALRGQDLPGKPLIESAVQQINSFSPPVMPTQTIRIGSYDGAARRFTFAMEDYYLPGIPPAKRQENGGVVPPQHRTELNSINVVYDVGLTNPPAGLRMTLTVSEPNGEKTQKDAAFGPGKATVAFAPHTFARQTLRIQGGGKDTSVVITPMLLPQLGAFTVPYLLATIVYEPPGKGSSADFSQTSTSNTVVSWSRVQGTGLVQTEDPEAFFNLFNQVMAAGVDHLAPGAGAAMTAVANLREQTSITKTTSSTVSADSSSGVSFAVTVGFTTTTHQYPGGGDLYVVLRDVLFVYLAHAGHITLSPMAYSGVTYLTGAELKQRLPATVADRFIALNPHTPGFRLLPVSLRTPSLGARGGTATGRLEPFVNMHQVECKHEGLQHLTASRTDFQSAGTSRSESQTLVYHVKGLMASIMGEGDHMETTSYSTAKTQGTSQQQSTQISISCAGDEEFWVKVYLDNLFRSFYTLRGDLLSANAAIAGTAQQDNGQPAANTQMRLDVGGETYVVTTDANGTFAFRVAAPNGPATLQLLGHKYPLRFAGRPYDVVLRGATLTERRAPPLVRRP